MDQKKRALTEKLHHGAKVTFENAEQLYNDATTLGMKGSFHRAVSLHQISMEECSKIDLFGASALSLKMGHEVDLDDLMKRVTKHHVKNFNNAYFSEMTEAERVAMENGDHGEARRIFKKQQKAHHDEVNKLKNQGLYVDYVGGSFISPSQSITEGMAIVMQRMNGFFLQHGLNHLRLFDRLLDDDPSLTGQLASFTAATAGFKDLKPEQVKVAFDKWVADEVAKHTAAKTEATG